MTARIEPFRDALGSPWFRERAQLILIAGAIIGTITGVWAIWVHITTDPLGDVVAYYEAGARLNADQPLYEPEGDTDVSRFYRYPPLIAILFRPLALLPYEVAAGFWGLAMLAAFGVLLWRISTGPRALIALGWLALPMGWSLAIGQAHVLLTTLIALGSPLSVALAANIKVFPVFVGLYWLGRRDWRAVGQLVAWGLAILGLQYVLEPAATTTYLTFLSLEQVGEVYNLSPYRFSPVLWGVFTVVIVVIALRLAPTRWGWAAAVVVATVVNPRLLVYQFCSLLAAVRAPGEPREPSVMAWWRARRANRRRGEAKTR